MIVYQHTWRAWAGVAWVVAISWFAIEAQKPPAALPIDAPDEVFAAGRAQKYVEEIARAPHPMGSDEAKRVRELLVQQLEQLFVWPTLAGLLGLGVKVQLPPGSVLGWVVTLFCSIPTLLLLPPLIRTT
jgi:hypothetical protein